MKREIIVTPQHTGGGAGAITYWQLRGEVNYADLGQRWVDSDLPIELLLESISEQAALRRACESLVDGTDTMVKPTRGRCTGFTLLRRSVVDENRAQWNSVFTAKLSNNGAGLHCWWDITGPDLTHLQDKVTKQMEHEMSYVQATDISHWLVTLARKYRAVSLRDAGGVYFVPPQLLDTWSKVKAVIDECAGTVYTIPAMSGEDAALAILDALKNDVDGTVKDMSDALADKDMGPRALNARIQQLADKVTTVGTYEEFLGQKLDDLKSSVERLRARYVRAHIKAQEEADVAAS